MSEDRVTVRPMYPSFAWFTTPEAEYKVVEHQDYVEVYRSDVRGRWRRRKTMPGELAKALGTLKKYELLITDEG